MKSGRAPGARPNANQMQAEVRRREAEARSRKEIENRADVGAGAPQDLTSILATEEGRRELLEELKAMDPKLKEEIEKNEERYLNDPGALDELIQALGGAKSQGAAAEQTGQSEQDQVQGRYQNTSLNETDATKALVIQGIARSLAEAGINMSESQMRQQEVLLSGMTLAQAQAMAKEYGVEAVTRSPFDLRLGGLDKAIAPKSQKTLQKGIKFLQEGKGDEALKQFEDAMKKSPQLATKMPSVLRYMAMAAESSKKHKGKALKFYESYLQHDLDIGLEEGQQIHDKVAMLKMPDRAQELYQQGIEAYQAGNDADLLKFWGELFSKYPKMRKLKPDLLSLLSQRAASTSHGAESKKFAEMMLVVAQNKLDDAQAGYDPNDAEKAQDLGNAKYLLIQAQNATRMAENPSSAQAILRASGGQHGNILVESSYRYLQHTSVARSVLDSMQGKVSDKDPSQYNLPGRLSKHLRNSFARRISNATPESQAYEAAPEEGEAKIAYDLERKEKGPGKLKQLFMGGSKLFQRGEGIGSKGETKLSDDKSNYRSKPEMIPMADGSEREITAKEKKAQRKKNILRSMSVGEDMWGRYGSDWKGQAAVKTFEAQGVTQTEAKMEQEIQACYTAGDIKGAKNLERKRKDYRENLGIDFSQAKAGITFLNAEALSYSKASADISKSTSGQGSSETGFGLQSRVDLAKAEANAYATGGKVNNNFNMWDATAGAKGNIGVRLDSEMTSSSKIDITKANAAAASKASINGFLGGRADANVGARFSGFKVNGGAYGALVAKANAEAGLTQSAVSAGAGAAAVAEVGVTGGVGAFGLGVNGSAYVNAGAAAKAEIGVGWSKEKGYFALAEAGATWGAGGGWSVSPSFNPDQMSDQFSGSIDWAGKKTFGWEQSSKYPFIHEMQDSVVDASGRSVQAVYAPTAAAASATAGLVSGLTTRFEAVSHGTSITPGVKQGFEETKELWDKDEKGKAVGAVVKTGALAVANVTIGHSIAKWDHEMATKDELKQKAQEARDKIGRIDDPKIRKQMEASLKEAEKCADVGSGIAAVFNIMDDPVWFGPGFTIGIKALGSAGKTITRRSLKADQANKQAGILELGLKDKTKHMKALQKDSKMLSAKVAKFEGDLKELRDKRASLESSGGSNDQLAEVNQQIKQKAGTYRQLAGSLRSITIRSRKLDRDAKKLIKEISAKRTEAGLETAAAVGFVLTGGLSEDAIGAYNQTSAQFKDHEETIKKRFADADKIIAGGGLGVVRGLYRKGQALVDSAFRYTITAVEVVLRTAANVIRRVTGTGKK